MSKPLASTPLLPAFDDVLASAGAAPLSRGRLTTLQVNVGKRCNQACHHCHVDAGPKRTETMDGRVAERLVRLLERSRSIDTVDLTGGAPELNPHFRALVEAARGLGKRVIDRCNLTVLFEPGMDGLAEFLAQRRVEIVASLPCYSAENVDRQRGRGVFGKSIDALVWLNQLGYGSSDRLPLDLVYNPLGPALPPDQSTLEARYRAELRQRFGIEFRRLLTLANMPIQRFAGELARAGRLDEYLALLVNHFNPATIGALMCKSLVSVGWDGWLYDCDFNQMLDMPLGGARTSIFDLDTFDGLAGSRIATARHCFGCTAGAGSSCSGAIR